MKLTVKVREATRNGMTGFEGTTTLPGLSRAKVAKVKDGTTLFPTTSALRTAARALGKRVFATVEFDEPVKKAAKKSVKAKVKKAKTKLSFRATARNTKLKTRR